MTPDDEPRHDQPSWPIAPTEGGAAPVEVVISETVAAAIAAHAAAGVAGVVRLEPGLASLATHLAARARHQLSHHNRDTPAPTEGVDVSVVGSAARVHIDLVTDPAAQAAAVAHQVQAAVIQAMQLQAGMSVTTVSVTVLDIDMQGVARTAGSISAEQA